MPVWLIALLVGGTAVAIAAASSKKSAPCATNVLAAPPNPFFRADRKALDWDALQAAWGSVYYQGDNEYRNLVDKVADYAKKSGNPYAVAAYYVLKGAEWVADRLSGDANGDDEKTRVSDYQERLLAWGFIPPMPSPGMTFRDIANGYAEILNAIDTRETYVKWLVLQGGVVFSKWGGLMLKAGTSFLVGDNKGYGTAPQPAAGPKVNDGPIVPLVELNVPRLRLAAAAIALDFGLQDRADAVTAITDAALWANENWQKVFEWRKAITQEGWCPARTVMGVDDAARIAAQNRGLTEDNLNWCSDHYPSLLMFYPWISVVPVYAYAGGIHAALTKAAELACLKGPPPLDASTADKDPTKETLRLNPALIGRIKL